MAKPKPKLDYLESLRGLAALAVVLFHARLTIAPDSPLTAHSLASNGYLAVDFFFVLSGFIIAYASDGLLCKWRAAAAFQLRRAMRLFPLHLVTLAAALGIELWLWSLAIPGTTAFERNDGTALLANLFLMQAFVGEKLTYNLPAWSISVEFVTYAVFACLTVLVPARWLPWCALAIVAGSGAFLLQLEDLDVIQWDGFVRCLFSFFMGAIVFRLSRLWRAPAALAVLALGSVVVLMCVRTGDGVSDMIFPPLFALCILALVASGPSRLKRLLEWRPLVVLGSLSFGVYLWHTLVFWVVGWSLGNALGARPDLMPEFHVILATGTPGQQTVVFLVGLGVTLWLSAVSYRLIERPAQRWARRQHFLTLDDSTGARAAESPAV